MNKTNKEILKEIKRLYKEQNKESKEYYGKYSDTDEFTNGYLSALVNIENFIKSGIQIDSVNEAKQKGYM